MRLILGFVVSVLLVGGFFGHASRGGASGASGGALSRQVAATPAEVVDALRASMSADGLDLVSRADDGDHFRQLIPATALSADPEFASAASEVGDIILTARVHPRGAEVRAAFTASGTSPGYEVTVAPAADGKGSTVAVASSVEEGTGANAARQAQRIRRVIDREAAKVLDSVVARVRA